MNAEKAKQKTDKYYYNRDVSDILVLIKKAIKHGKYSIYAFLTKEQRDWLLCEGYKVKDDFDWLTLDTDRTKRYYINWD